MTSITMLKEDMDKNKKTSSQDMKDDIKESFGGLGLGLGLGSGLRLGLGLGLRLGLGLGLELGLG
jgi:hypothetical protein